MDLSILKILNSLSYYLRRTYIISILLVFYMEQCKKPEQVLSFLSYIYLLVIWNTLYSIFSSASVLLTQAKLIKLLKPNYISFYSVKACIHYDLPNFSYIIAKNIPTYATWLYFFLLLHNPHGDMCNSPFFHLCLSFKNDITSKQNIAYIVMPGSDTLNFVLALRASVSIGHISLLLTIHLSELVTQPLLNSMRQRYITF